MQLRDAEKIKKCVVYIGYVSDNGPIVCGTGFFVSYCEKPFLITARHNYLKAEASGATKLLIRFNRKGSGAGEFEVELKKWRMHSDKCVDATALPISENEILTHDMDVLLYPAINFVTPEKIESMPITVGDEVFFPGLFSLHAGTSRNTPIVRSGNIAAMADEPVQIDWFGSTVGMDAYLVEARSLGGLSGAPVFVHVPIRVRESIQDEQTVIKRIIKPTEHCLLGLVHGHYDEKQRNSETGINQSINMGIAIVVPFAKVIELLDEYFEEVGRPNDGFSFG